MNLAVEQSLTNWLRSLEAFDGIPVHTGQSSDEIPGDTPAIICAAESVEAMSTVLHKATASIVLATPSTLDLDQHRQLVDSLRAALYAPHRPP